MGPLHPHVHRPPERTESKAVLSLVLGLVSMGCGGPVAGVPAMVLGALARRDIDRSNGLLLGRALAAAGIVSGLFGTGLGIVAVLWFVGGAVTPEAPVSTAAISASAPAPTLAEPVTEPPLEDVSPLGMPAATRSYGSFEVVDLDESRPLRAQLAEIVKRSRGRTVILQTYAKSSAACASIEAALPDRRMQRALADVTLVRADVDEYTLELHWMNVETMTAPWFYKLDARGEPTDALSAEAWEATVPENIAPILGKFVRPAPPPRRPQR